jgi:hypothetical protein
MLYDFGRLEAENARQAAEIERLQAMMQSIAEAERLAEENRITVVIDGSHVVRVGPSLADIIRQFQTEIERLTAENEQLKQELASITYYPHLHRMAAEIQERLDLAEPYSEEIGI